MQRFRSPVAWLVLLALPLSWCGAAPEAVVCVRADGTVAVESYGACLNLNGPVKTVLPADAGDAVSAGSDGCGLCADFPLRMHVPTAATGSFGSAPLERSLAVGLDAHPATIRTIQAACAGVPDSVGHTLLASLRTVILLI